MIRLLNSAVMPKAGIYRIYPISKKEFVETLNHNEFQSYIGYQQNIDILKEMGVTQPIRLSRKETQLQDGDTLLVMKLKYRLSDVSKKGRFVVPEDFEFYQCAYTT